MTSTLNPLKIESTIEQVMKEVRKQMIKDGFLVRN
jgi:hypothetical protein